MEQIKELTKRLIANSFKELMLQLPFEKITIKMITDHANVIRPTFYNHFHDKYELLEWILQDEILERAEECFHLGDGSNAIQSIISGMYEERDFYRKAFDVEGQNGFAETFASKLAAMFRKASGIQNITGDNADAKQELVSRYYASGLITVIRFMIFDAGDMKTDDIIMLYKHLVNHTVYDVLSADKPE